MFTILFHNDPGKQPRIVNGLLFLAIILLLLLTAIWNLQAQNNMGVGTTTPHPSAGVDVDYPDKGVLVPRLTTAQRNTISSPAPGLLIYNVDDSCFNFFNSNIWRNLCAPDSEEVKCQSIAGTATVDTICGDTVTLTLTGYNGNIQWQVSFDQVNFYNNTYGIATTPVYTSIVDWPVIFFRAAVADSGCPVAYSNIISVNRNCCCQISDTWCERAGVPYWFGATSGARDGAIATAVGGKGYWGTGASFRKDWWEYDPVLNFWTQKANFAGGRRNAVAFSIGSKVYAGTGVDASGGKNDWWQYDPTANIWTKKANFPGGGRYYAVAVAIGSKGYAGLGENGPDYKDWWEYDPAVDSWVQKTDLPGVTRWAAVAFAVGGKAYVGTGSNLLSTMQNDFYEYDPANNSWTAKAPFPFGGINAGLYKATAFAIGSKGYVGTGTGPKSAPAKQKIFYEYNPGTDTWTQKTDFAGTARDGAVSFVIGNNGYILTGDASNAEGDMWMYCP